MFPDQEEKDFIKFGSETEEDEHTLVDTGFVTGTPTVESQKVSPPEPTAPSKSTSIETPTIFNPPKASTPIVPPRSLKPAKFGTKSPMIPLGKQSPSAASEANALMQRSKEAHDLAISRFDQGTSIGRIVSDDKNPGPSTTPAQFYSNVDTRRRRKRGLNAFGTQLTFGIDEDLATTSNDDDEKSTDQTTVIRNPKYPEKDNLYTQNNTKEFPKERLTSSKQHGGNDTINRINSIINSAETEHDKQDLWESLQEELNRLKERSKLNTPLSGNDIDRLYHQALIAQRRSDAMNYVLRNQSIPFPTSKPFGLLSERLEAPKYKDMELFKANTDKWRDIHRPSPIPYSFPK